MPLSEFCRCAIPEFEKPDGCAKCGKGLTWERVAQLSCNCNSTVRENARLKELISGIHECLFCNKYQGIKGSDESQMTKASFTSVSKATKSQCKYCNSPILPGQKFCSNCGEKSLLQEKPIEIKRGRVIEGIEEKENVQGNGWIWGSIGAIILLLLIFSSVGTSPDKAKGGYSAVDACQDISDIYDDYFREFEEFRYGPDDGTGWAPLRSLTKKANSRIDGSLAKMSGGITWDSYAITSSFLSAASSYMTEILNSVERGFFSPGRDLEALLREIKVNLTSVADSACN
jgi:DNA-directed RNA polymerase subunit RPC12/RpoP